MLIQNRAVRSIRKQFEEKGYTFFDGNKPFNLNIFGVRSKNAQINKFDDFLFCVYRDHNLNWVMKQWAATTDPGLGPMLKPANPKGVAILKPNQYRGAYKLDYHRGRYLALCQRLKPVTVYRDNNKNTVKDYVNEEAGFFGINIHKAGRISERVDNWSEGCQVFKRSKDFDDLIVLSNKASKLYGNSFTYTLFDEV